MEQDQSVRKIRTDMLEDAVNLTLEALSTLIKSAVAFALLRYIFDLHYQQALEVAALLGAADFFSRPPQMRTTTDLRERIQYTRIGRVVRVTDDKEEKITKE
jgi:hypothetical protein